MTFIPCKLWFDFHRVFKVSLVCKTLKTKVKYNWKSIPFWVTNCVIHRNIDRKYAMNNTAEKRLRMQKVLYLHVHKSKSKSLPLNAVNAKIIHATQTKLSNKAPRKWLHSNKVCDQSKYFQYKKDHTPGLPDLLNR